MTENTENDDRTTTDRTSTDANRDPISGASGAHPVGTAAGALSGAAAGAAVGTMVGGPIGTAVGGVVGAVAGGLGGKGIAEAVNPTQEDAYWRANYSSRPYANKDTKYESLEPAYRYGWESRANNAGKQWEEVESDLSNGWDEARGTGKLAWSDAKMATRDAWDHIRDEDSQMNMDDDGGSTRDDENSMLDGSRRGSSKNR